MKKLTLKITLLLLITYPNVAYTNSGQIKYNIIELENLELKISTLSKDIFNIQKKIKEQEVKKLKLQKELSNIETNKKSQEQELNSYIRQQYLLSKISPIQLLLTTQDPYQAIKITSYYQYLSINTNHTITTLQEKILHTKQLKDYLKINLLELTNNKINRTTELKELKNLYGQRKAIVEKLEQQEHNEKLLLEQTQETVHNKSQLNKDSTIDNYLPEQTMDFIKTFKSPLFPDQKLKKNKSSFLVAKYRKKVFAVKDGTIVFSNWLRGFGMLIIIEHDHGLMSLYGHNETILKNVGESVKGGELIALVGKSGGHSKIGLYFEIRHLGKPI